jgi:HEAT repeat protein
LQNSKFPAAEVVPALRKELKAGMDTYDKWHVAKLCLALGRFDAAAAPAVPELGPALKHAEECVRRYAAEALGNIGKASESLLPALRNLAQSDPEGRVREWAGAAVKKIEAARF